MFVPVFVVFAAAEVPVPEPEPVLVLKAGVEVVNATVVATPVPEAEPEMAVSVPEGSTPDTDAVAVSEFVSSVFVLPVGTAVSESVASVPVGTDTEPLGAETGTVAEAEPVGTAIDVSLKIVSVYSVSWEERLEEGKQTYLLEGRRRLRSRLAEGR